MDDKRSRAMAHLVVANEIRLRRAGERRAIEKGDMSAAQVLREAPTHWHRSQIVDLLCMTPWVGRVKARRWCRIAGVSPMRRVGTLTEREREVLARAVDVWNTRHQKKRGPGGAMVPPGPVRAGLSERREA